MAVPNLVISIKYPYLKEMLGYYDGEQTDLDDNRRGLDDFIFINYINHGYQIQINSLDCFDAAMRISEEYESETCRRTPKE